MQVVTRRVAQAQPWSHQHRAPFKPVQILTRQLAQVQPQPHQHRAPLWQVILEHRTQVIRKEMVLLGLLPIAPYNHL